MSVLTSIGGVPLFSTIEQAEKWARKFKVKGYHTHKHGNKIGYMGGMSHYSAVKALRQSMSNRRIDNSNGTSNIQSINTSTSRNINTSTNTPTSPSPSTSTGGGGGGGY